MDTPIISIHDRNVSKLPPHKKCSNHSEYIEEDKFFIFKRLTKMMEHMEKRKKNYSAP